MFGGNFFFRCQVGDRLRDFEESKVRARGQPIPLDGMSKDGFGFREEDQVLSNLFAREFGIGRAAGFVMASGLAIAGGLDAASNALA